MVGKSLLGCTLKKKRSGSETSLFLFAYGKRVFFVSPLFFSLFNFSI